MTPTEAYKTAEGRDAGHDEFQAHVWRQIQSGFLPSIRHFIGEKPLNLPFVSAEVEFPIMSSGKGGRYIGAYADIVVNFAMPESTNYYRLLIEIKPKIYSVGSVIRQCKALEHIARSAFDDRFRVKAVAPLSDPKLDLLQEMFPGGCVGWDWTP